MIKKAVLAAAAAAATVVAATPARRRRRRRSTAELVLPGQPDLERLQADPGPDYSDPSDPADASKKWRVALILVDYPDRPFTISQPAGSTIFGTPSALAHSVPRDAGAAVLRRLPQQAAGAEQLPDHEPVLDGGLLRQVRRRARAVRPVPAAAEVLPVPHRQLPERDRRLPEPDAGDPNRTPCNQNFFNAARGAWEADVPARPSARRSTTASTSPRARTRARPGRSSARCASPTQDAVTDAFGPKAIDPLHPRGNWATTRYIPWTSWAAAANIWPSAGGQQLDRGRELRHGRVRARALAQPRHPGQLQQPVRRAASSAPPAACGT